MVTGRSIVANSFRNVGYQAVPILAAIVCIPIGIRALGSNAFGLYSLASTILVLTNLLNLGIGASVTHYVATVPSEQERASVVGYGFVLMAILGVMFGSLFLIVAAQPHLIVGDVSNEQLKLARELFVLTALLLPLALLVNLFRAVLEGLHLFQYTAVSRAIVGSAIVVAPVTASFEGVDVVAVLGIVGGVYCCVMVALGIVVTRHVRVRLAISPVDWRLLRSVVRSGGWIGLVSVLTATLVYVDRFIIAHYGGLESVTYYVAVFDVITRLSIVSGSITAVLFPAVSYWFVNKEVDLIAVTVARAYKSIGVLVSVCVIGAIVYSRELLAVWLGTDFALHGARVMQLLSIGVLLNCLAAVPHRTIVAMGFPNRVARVYAILTPLHIVITLIAVRSFGASGAALTYVVRAGLELVILGGILVKTGIATGTFRHFGVASRIAAQACIAAGAAYWLSTVAGSAKVAGLIILTACVMWRFYRKADDTERLWLKARVKVLGVGAVK